MEDHQAQALATGDIADFRLDVDWASLAGRTATPEPLVRGYSNRWYVTDLDLGQGVTTGGPSGGNDNRPNYLGRVQPYAVYVPTTYRPGTPAPLTWIEHSLSVNLNQYGALAPRQLQAECEDRGSICATTEGFGPDGWYFDEAEHDFWQVWRQLGLSYTLDPERTVMSGYSMGGYASYKLALTHPDLFARSMPLAGPPTCGLQVAGDVRTGTLTGGHCGADGDTGPLVANATWIPYVLGDGVADELVPYTSVLEQVQRFDAAGLRYHFETYPAEDHLVYATQDGFSSEVAALGGTPARVTDPGAVHYSWYPDLVDARLGLGPTTVYWLSGLRSRVSGPGALATVEATDGARPEPGHTVTRSTSPLVPGDPSPGVAVDSTWTPTGTTPAAGCTLALRLTGVAALTVDTARALLPHGTATVAADGPASLTLSRLAPGTVVRSGTATAAAGHDGTATVPVTGGSTVTW
jgi:pimeloyl-ACP methyl ester carboxylesterase